MSARPPIPQDTQLAVRQRCGFACVLCGRPIYEIHHLEEYAVSASHDVRNLTLLCPNHHTEATKGLIDAAEIKAANAEPFAVREGKSGKHEFRFNGDSCRVWFGDSDAASFGTAGRFSALMIDGQEILGFQFRNNRPLLNLILLNEQNVCLLAIQEGCLEYTPKVWDIRLQGKTLTLRDAPGRIRLRLEFCPPSEIRLHNTLLLCNGIALKVAQQGVCLLNNGHTMAFEEVVPMQAEHQVAISLGLQHPTLAPAVSQTGINRYRGISFGKRITDIRKPAIS